MRTPMTWQPEQRAWVTSMSVPVKLLPLSLAMVLYFPGERGLYGCVFGEACSQLS
jgi:hypothetical protein